MNSSTSERPNILLFVTDGWQAHTLSDGHDCKTPTIDGLIERGVRITGAHTTLPTYSDAPKAEQYPLAVSRAQTALALDDSLAEAHAVLGDMARDALKWPEAKAHYLYAIASEPKNSTAHLWYAEHLTSVGCSRCFWQDAPPRSSPSSTSTTFPTPRVPPAAPLDRRTLSGGPGRPGRSESRRASRLPRTAGEPPTHTGDTPVRPPP